MGSSQAPRVTRLIDTSAIEAAEARAWADVYSAAPEDWAAEVGLGFREDGRLVGARGMCVGPDGAAWLGMDAPVPGVMTHWTRP
jgi:hypothetical protein